MIIDAHAHLWETQNGEVNGKPVIPLLGGQSNFGGEIRQMMPPYMIDGKNTAQMFISNMNYGGVSAAVITQEYIDGNQNEYLKRVKEEYTNRIKICSLYEENDDYELDKFDGIKICAGRLKQRDLTIHSKVFESAQKANKFISIDLCEGNYQVDSMREIITQYPKLRIAIGHFGMVNRLNWQKQIELAKNKNVFIESGGITWLFNDEYYPYKSAIDAILEASYICGMEKLMWGSDYPRTMTAITYKMSYDFILKSNKLSNTQKVMFLGDNARQFYGFNDLPEATYIKNMLED